MASAGIEHILNDIFEFESNCVDENINIDLSTLEIAVSRILHSKSAIYFTEEGTESRAESSSDEKAVEASIQEGKLGPSEVQLTQTGSCGNYELSNSNLTAKGISNFSSIRANVCVFEGKWMYEVTLHTAGVQQLGWCTLLTPFTNEEGVGDSEESYAYDGNRIQKWNKDHSNYGQEWAIGDIIGCCIDLEDCTATFFRNGMNLGQAFSDIRKGPNCAYFPGISISAQEICSLNFGANPFRYPIPGYKPLQKRPSEIYEARYLSQCLIRLLSHASTWEIPQGFDVHLLQGKEINSTLPTLGTSEITPKEKLSPELTLLIANHVIKPLSRMLVLSFSDSMHNIGMRLRRSAGFYILEDAVLPILVDIYVNGSDSALRLCLDLFRLCLSPACLQVLARRTIHIISSRVITTPYIYGDPTQSINPEAFHKTPTNEWSGVFWIQLLIKLLEYGWMDYWLYGPSRSKNMEQILTIIRPSANDKKKLIPAVWYKGIKLECLSDEDFQVSRSEFEENIQFCSVSFEETFRIRCTLCEKFLSGPETWKSTFLNWLDEFINNNRDATRRTRQINSSVLTFVTIQGVLSRLCWNNYFDALITPISSNDENELHIPKFPFDPLLTRPENDVLGLDRVGGALSHLLHNEPLTSLHDFHEEKQSQDIQQRDQSQDQQGCGQSNESLPLHIKLFHSSILIYWLGVQQYTRQYGKTHLKLQDGIRKLKKNLLLEAKKHNLQPPVQLESRKRDDPMERVSSRSYILSVASSAQSTWTENQLTEQKGDELQPFSLSAIEDSAKKVILTQRRVVEQQIRYLAWEDNTVFSQYQKKSFFTVSLYLTKLVLFAYNRQDTSLLYIPEAYIATLLDIFHALRQSDAPYNYRSHFCVLQTGITSALEFKGDTNASSLNSDVSIADILDTIFGSSKQICAYKLGENANFSVVIGKEPESSQDTRDSMDSLGQVQLNRLKRRKTMFSRDGGELTDGLNAIITLVVRMLLDPRVKHPEVKTMFNETLQAMMYRPRFIRAIEQCPAASHYLIPCLINAMAGEQWFGVCSMMRLIWSGTRFFELFSLPIVLDGISSWDVSSPVLQETFRRYCNSNPDQLYSFLHNLMNHISFASAEISSVIPEIIENRNNTFVLAITNLHKRFHALFDLLVELLYILESVIWEIPSLVLYKDTQLTRIAETLGFLMHQFAVGPSSHHFNEILNIAKSVEQLERIDRSMILAPIVGILYNILHPNDQHSDKQSLDPTSSTDSGEITLDSRLLGQFCESSGINQDMLSILTDDNVWQACQTKYRFESDLENVEENQQYDPNKKTWCLIRETVVHKDKVLQCITCLIRHVSENGDMQRDTDAITEEHLCFICYAKKIDTEFEPCKHQSCHMCIERHMVNSNLCFYCKVPIVRLRTIGDDEVDVSNTKSND